MTGSHRNVGAPHCLFDVDHDEDAQTILKRRMEGLSQVGSLVEKSSGEGLVILSQDRVLVTYRYGCFHRRLIGQVVIQRILQSRGFIRRRIANYCLDNSLIKIGNISIGVSGMECPMW